MCDLIMWQLVFIEGVVINEWGEWVGVVHCVGVTALTRNDGIVINEAEFAHLCVSRDLHFHRLIGWRQDNGSYCTSSNNK